MFFFFNDTATTEIYTLSLHDALPISSEDGLGGVGPDSPESALHVQKLGDVRGLPSAVGRSEEHTSELQSRQYLVCRLLLEKKKKASNRVAMAGHDGKGARCRRTARR